LPLAFFFDTFFLDAFLDAFLATFFFAIFFLLTRFFFVALDLDARFLVTAFFLVTLRLLLALPGAGFFFAVTFRRVAETLFRFLLAAFFAGILDSCRLEKRRGLYIACRRMEAHSEPGGAPVSGRQNGRAGRRGAAAMRIVLFRKFL
jgi:hypothetical protein